MPASPTAPTARGFSLLELLLVLTIIGTVAAIAVPRYTGSLQRYRAEMAAHRVAADLDYARRQAMASTMARTVVFYPAAGEYRIGDVAGLKGGSGSYIVDLASDPYRCTILSATFDSAIDAGDDPQGVTFDGYGMPDSGGTVVVRAGKHDRTVVLDAETGEAEVQ